METIYNSKLILGSVALFFIVMLSLLPTTSVSADTLSKERIIDDNLIANENDTCNFDKTSAIEQGLSGQDAEVAEQFSNELLNNGNISGREIQPMIAPPIMLLLPSLGKAAASAVKAAVAGGSVAIGVAFATDIYNTTAYTACQNHYGKVGAIDNYCEANGHGRLIF